MMNDKKIKYRRKLTDAYIEKREKILNIIREATQDGVIVYIVTESLQSSEAVTDVLKLWGFTMQIEDCSLRVKTYQEYHRTCNVDADLSIRASDFL